MFPGWAEVNPTSTFICSPTFPGNPNIYNSIAPNVRVRDIIPRVRRSYEARVLPDYFNRASHFQRLRPLVTRARQDPMLLRYPPESPRFSNHISVTPAWTRILAHRYCARVTQGFVSTIRAASGIVRDDGREDFMRDILGANEARVQLLEIQHWVIA